MSSLRNAVQRRNHKERAQPLERSKWGLLEKHKDYSLRAKDHNTKKRKIKALQQKAATRNEDEFYYAMMNSSTRKGVKVAKRGEQNSGGGGKSLSHDVVKLMKTQDVTYLRTVLQTTRKSADRLEQEVTMLEQGVSLEGSGIGRKVFVEDDGGAEAVEAEGDEELSWDEDESEDDGAKEETPSKKKRDPVEKKKRHTLKVKQRQLEALRSRQQELTAAILELEDQRERMNGKMKGVTQDGIKYRTRGRRR